MLLIVLGIVLGSSVGYNMPISVGSDFGHLLHMDAIDGMRVFIRAGSA